MKVKIGNETYDPNNIPIMVILTDQDKENIKNMHKDKMKYIAYPDTISDEEIDTWIKGE